MNNPQPQKYLLKIHWRNGKAQRIQRTSNRRISAFVQTINWSDVEKIYLRVEYSLFINNLDKKVLPLNEGGYSDRDLFFLALNCFVEK